MKAVLFAFFLLNTASAFAGNEHGNGGDSFSLEFVSIGRKLVEEIRRNPDPRISESALVVAVETTDVSTKDRLELREIEVDAINYPKQKRIELNRPRWREANEQQKAALVLHEYLGVIGVDDSRYEISGKYAEAFRRASNGGTNASFALEQSPSEKQSLSVGAGAGYNTFGSNMGKLAGSEGPSLDFRLTYELSREFSLRANLSTGGFAFNAEPNGSVEMELLTLGLSLQHHFLQSLFLRDQLGIDPYLLLGASQNFRSQNFQTLNDVQKDNAIGIHGGLGSNFKLFSSKRISIWAEGRIAKIYFQDRFEQTYLESGLADTTGPLYTAAVGLQYSFN